MIAPAADRRPAPAGRRSTGCTPPRASRPGTTRSPLEEYAGLTTFTADQRRVPARGHRPRGRRRAARPSPTAGLTAADVDYLLFTSVTGIGAPSIDVLLVDAARACAPTSSACPCSGSGCVGGAAGIARVRDYLQGHPHDVALLVSVELCSLTLQHGDDSMANIVSSGLFGDGASAVVMVGATASATSRRRRRRRHAQRALPGHARPLGWDIGGSGFRIVLSPSMADIVEQHLGGDVIDLLAAHGLKVSDVGTWVAHTGGPRILRVRGAGARAARRGASRRAGRRWHGREPLVVGRAARARRRARGGRPDPRLGRRAVRHRPRRVRRDRPAALARGVVGDLVPG